MNKCKHCDEVCKNKFCNRSCSAKFNNKLRRKEHKLKFCLNCSHVLNRIFRGGKYCSKDCELIYKRKLLRDRILFDSALISSRILKDFLIQEYGNKCMECGWCKTNPFTNKVPIELEHINGNSEDNRLNNLKLLCPSCHSLTPTYRALNIGNGRHKRRVRYKEGKSF